MMVYEMADAGRTETEIAQSGLLDRLDGRKRQAAARYIRREPVYDGTLATALLDSPEVLQQTDLRSLKGEVSRPELEMLARRQAMGQTPEGRDLLEKLAVETGSGLVQNGLNRDWGKRQDTAARAMMEDYLVRSVEAFRKEHKRYPADKERRELIRHAIGEVVIPAFLEKWHPGAKGGKEGTAAGFSLSPAERKRVLKRADALGFSGTEAERIRKVLSQRDGMRK